MANEGQWGGTWWRSPGWPIPAWVHTNAPYLSHAGYRLGEMMAPNVPPIEMRSPGPRSGLGLIMQTVSDGGVTGAEALPAQFYQSGPGGAGYVSGGGGGGGLPAVSQSAGQTSTTVQTSNPVFLDTGGNVITSAVCGSIYSMTVPGYEHQTLYIVQTKNGAPSFSGNMAIPMPNYASVCNQDEGNYQLQAFDPLSGTLIGQTTFTVLPAAVPTTTTAPPAAAIAPASSSAGPATSGPGTTALPAPGAMPPTGAPIAAAPAAGLSQLDWVLILAAIAIGYAAGRY